LRLLWLWLWLLTLGPVIAPSCAAGLGEKARMFEHMDVRGPPLRGGLRYARSRRPETGEQRRERRSRAMLGSPSLWLLSLGEARESNSAAAEAAETLRHAKLMRLKKEEQSPPCLLPTRPHLNPSRDNRRSPTRTSMKESFHATTIVCARRGTSVVIGGDGQVSMGNTVVKANARKVRRLAGGKVLAGFAGATADAFTLFELFEAKLEKHGQLVRAAVELAKDWRTDRRLGRLEALLAVADRDSSLIISGNGDVLEPEDGLIAIGSGGPFALAAAKALLSATDMAPREVVERALSIAADICIYTNHNRTFEEL